VVNTLVIATVYFAAAELRLFRVREIVCNNSKKRKVIFLDLEKNVKKSLKIVRLGLVLETELATEQSLRSGTDDLIDEVPAEKRHLSKLIIICRI